LGFFALGAIRNLFVIIALEHYSWTTVLFPAAVGISCALVAVFLAIRRMTVLPEGLESNEGAERG
jgi:ABC-type Mn2+/Zn2+ transport system permease subunit